MKHFAIAISLLFFTGCSHKVATMETFTLDAGRGAGVPLPTSLSNVVVEEEKKEEVAPIVDQLAVQPEVAQFEVEVGPFRPSPEPAAAPAIAPQAEVQPAQPNGNVGLIGGVAPFNRNFGIAPAVNIGLFPNSGIQPNNDILGNLPNLDDTPAAPAPNVGDIIVAQPVPAADVLEVEPADFHSSPEPDGPPVPAPAPPPAQPNNEVLVDHFLVEVRVERIANNVQGPPLYIDFFKRTDENISGPAVAQHSVQLFYQEAGLYHSEIRLEQGIPLGDFDFLRLRRDGGRRSEEPLHISEFHFSLFGVGIPYDIGHDKLNLTLYGNMFVVFPRFSAVREALINRNPMAFAQLYRANFKTADVGGAGTDVRVDLQLTGHERIGAEEEARRWNTLSTPWNGRDLFERGHLDQIPLCFGEPGEDVEGNSIGFSSQMQGDQAVHCFPSGRPADAAYPGQFDQIQIEAYQTDANNPEWNLDWFSLEVWMPEVGQFITISYNDLPANQQWIDPSAVRDNHNWRTFDLQYVVGIYAP